MRLPYLLPFLRHRFLDPLKELTNDSRSIGIVLLGATLISLLIANSPLDTTYTRMWNISLSIPYIHAPHTLLHWINDGLMSLFFLMAGMEIKSELKGGELRNPKSAALPLGAAVGGMLIPAIIFALFNYDQPFYKSGWGVPMATDIAFAIGVSSLLGKKVPYALKIFLTALATVDDLGAIVVIALFYGGQVQWVYMLATLICSFFIHLYLRTLSKPNLILALSGLLLWYFVYNSGIHASVSGVLFGFLMPIRWLHRISIYLHNWVYFLILPVFALANTAVSLHGFSAAALWTPLAGGIGLGLLLGKPMGVLGGSFLLFKAGLAKLPENVSWPQLLGAGLLAGIGFTMSIFISLLAFTSPEVQELAKVIVLISSALSIVISILYFRFTGYQR